VKGRVLPALAVALACALVTWAVAAQAVKTTYVVLATDADVAKTEEALWTAYYAREIVTRGLVDGQCLDVQPDGSRVCITARYTEAIKADGQTGGLLVADTFVKSLDGVTVTTATKGDVTLSVVEVESKNVPAKYKPAIEPTTPSTKDPAPDPAPGPRK
jgi:hypothetical protein